MAAKNSAVIVRRSKKPGHAQRHGGHWKVAYADFMTAMMAFFLLLWILAVTDESKLDGIAQFFTPTENVAGQPGGEGILQGSAIAQDQNVLSAPSQEQKASDGAPNPWAELAAASQKPSDVVMESGEALERAGEQFLESVQNQPAIANLAGNLLVRQIEGQLVVDIIDLGNEPMFEAGSAQPADNLSLVIKALAPMIRALPHPIRVTGHTDRLDPNLNPDVDAWAMSAQRGLAVRSLLIAEGLAPMRFSLVSGAGDSRPLDPLKPMEANNRRVTIELGSALD